MQRNLYRGKNSQLFRSLEYKKKEKGSSVLEEGKGIACLGKKGSLNCLQTERECKLLRGMASGAEGGPELVKKKERKSYLSKGRGP